MKKGKKIKAAICVSALIVGLSNSVSAAGIRFYDGFFDIFKIKREREEIELEDITPKRGDNAPRGCKGQGDEPEVKDETNPDNGKKHTPRHTEKATEKKKEKETEASDRVNDGKKIEESTVTSRLGSVRTKLFAADSVILPDTLKEQVGADWILDGTDGKAAVDGLSGLSKTLANGQSTSKVEVINLYADKDGKLDTKQLEKLFKDKVIDVTDQYFVVNIIAAKKDQTLSFSGYAMKNKGQKKTVKITK